MPHRRLGTVLTSHLVLAGLLTAFCAWYLADAWLARASIHNLILIAPVGVAAILIGLVLLVREVRAPSAPPPPEAGTFPLMGLLIGFVILLPIVGFSASIFLFLIGSTRLMGVRNPVSLILYAALFTVVLVFLLGQAVRLPDPWIAEWP